MTRLAYRARAATQRLRGLYAITGGEAMGVERLAQAVTQALEGGATLIQYRDKSTDAVQREAEARTLLEICRSHQVPLIINDDVDLARTVGADGVHLGRDDASVADARRMPQMEAFIAGQRTLLQQAQPGTLASVPDLPREIDSAGTAAYIRSVMSGTHAVPPSIARQVEHILHLTSQL